MKKNRYILMVNDYFARMDKIFYLIVAIIAIFNLLILNSVSRATNTNYFETQLIAIIIGVLGATLVTLVDYTSIASYWILMGAGSIFLMIYTAFFGINIVGGGGVNATAWISFLGRSFQSSELVKIVFLITFAKHMNLVREEGRLNQFIQVFFLCVHAAIPVLLCHLQGDDGAGIIFLFMFLFMSYVGGIQIRYFIILGAIILISLPILWNFVLSDYQKIRFSSVLNLDDPTVAINEGYQQFQARISIGSGGFLGQGLMNGPRVETNLVTFQHSDFVLSVVGEELGFIGCVFLMLTLLALMWRVIYIANKSRDYLGKIMCFGFLGLITVQTISNLGMCLALLPVMGVTLPFYSAGGSSAACLYLGIGVLQSVYMHKNDIGGIRLRFKENNELGYKDLNLN